MTDKIQIGDVLFINKSLDEWAPLPAIVKTVGRRWAWVRVEDKWPKDVRVDMTVMKVEFRGWLSGQLVSRSKSDWVIASAAKANEDHANNLWEEVCQNLGRYRMRRPENVSAEDILAAGRLLGIWKGGE